MPFLKSLTFVQITCILRIKNTFGLCIEYFLITDFINYQGVDKMEKIKILGIAVPDGAVLDLIELYAIPVFNQDNEMTPNAAVLEFKRQILTADAILFSTPEYNYSISGGLKNAIDWASRPSGENVWLGKPSAIMGASTGNFGTARAQYHLRQILVSQNMPVVNKPEVMISNAAQHFDNNGRLTDESTRKLIQQLLSVLVQLAKINTANKC
jgi:chromate reductase